MTNSTNYWILYGVLLSLFYFDNCEPSCIVSEYLFIFHVYWTVKRLCLVGRDHSTYIWALTDALEQQIYSSSSIQVKATYFL